MSESTKKNIDKKTVKGRTSGQFRCLYCFKRITAPPGAKSTTCPHCGYAWRISWFSPGEPRIRGPVWENNEAMTRKIMAESKGGSK